MKRIIIVLSLLALGTFLFLSLKPFTQPQNDLIDHLSVLSAPLVKEKLNTKNVYFFSNNSGEELYYKAQFVFAPYVLAKTNYPDIPSGSLLLVLTDINLGGIDIPNDCELINTQANNFLDLKLLRKK